MRGWARRATNFNYYEKGYKQAGGPTLKSYRHEAKKWVGGWVRGKFSQKVTLCKN